MTKKYLLPVLILLFASAGASFGQEPVCDRQKTFADCIDQLLGTRKVDIDMSIKATSLNAPANSRGLLDLLPTFASSLGIDGLKNQNGKLTLDRRFELGQWRVSFNGTAYLDAELFAPLVTKLPESIKEARSKTLNAQIGDFDKVDYQVTVTREDGNGDRRFGRDPDDYANLLNAWIKDLIFVNQTDFNKRLEAAAAVLPEDQNISSVDRLLQTPIAQLDLSDDKIAEIETNLKGVCARVNKEWAKLDNLTDRAGELINNQPQVLFDGKFEDRDPLVGAEKRSAKFTYEMGVAGNMNSYLRWARSNVSADCAGDAEKRSCLEAYLKAEPDAAKSGQRLAIALAYSDTRPIHFELPADQFVFDQPGAEKWIGSLTYGRYFPKFRFFDQLGGDPSSNQGTRVDLDISYEDPFEKDGMFKSRLVGTLTFTQGMTKNTGMSFSIIYANRPEFLGEVDEKLSANIGYRWKTGTPAAN